MANFALEPSIKPSKPLALTLGEPAGIGPDITIAAWLRRRELNLPAFYLLGDEAFVARRAKALGADIRIASVSAGEAAAAFTEALPVVATGEVQQPSPASPMKRARRPRSLRSGRRSPTSVKAAPAPSSPTRSPRACSTAQASAIPATPNTSPSSPQRTAACRSR